MQLVARVLSLLVLALLGAATAQAAGAPRRTVVADVVAINQPLVYNRFGSTNPWGMIYALRRDTTGTEPGQAMLKEGKRPRPLVLRVSAGDILEIRFQNLLKPMPPGSPNGPAEGPEGAEPREPAEETITVPDPPNDPRTRLASIAIVGLTTENGTDPRATGLMGLQPGESQVYRFRADKAGSYFFSSLSAVAGGEGNGGSLTHGLFGMVIVEPKGAKYYRSQVTAEALDCARGRGTAGQCTANPRKGWVDYEAKGPDGTPILNMLLEKPDGSAEIVHSDLTAIIVDPNTAGDIGQPASDYSRSGQAAWREFAIMFHDELKTTYVHEEFAILDDKNAKTDAEKARTKQMAGGRDGFAINYGASGMGPIVLANRAGKGPAKTCVDCAYEEFFLQSWANGDPALLAQYRDDPSNVYHSYLGDRVKFYNVHAGPKETHVFHLHAHQWLSQSGNKSSNYLDSQTIAPFQTFSYEIYYGGTGNRNLTPGDSIFHCHLYPHFAQGMWGLWRVHEVIEDGRRALPDGGGMNNEYEGLGTDPMTGQTAGGTPIPGLVPLPGQALPPEPTYIAQAGEKAMPGYPFYIPGKRGFRAPQPPLDMLAAAGGEDAGLPRHLTLEGTRTLKPIEAALDTADMTYPINSVKLQILPQTGTPLEKAAMAFHAQAGGTIMRPVSDNLTRTGRFLVNGLAAAPGAPFANPCPETGQDARHWSPGLRSQMTGTRTYDVAAVQLNLVVNQYGWHDKQARINVLSKEAEAYENQTRAADPFFFRARSGECIVFRHTNRTPGHTTKDAFQVATPVDIIGQHIHLVKFDVTSSDGSANGFNYEDGTFAHDHIKHMIEAAKAPGGSVDWSQSGEAPRELALKTDAQGKPVFQTTIQRWWADPLLDEKGRDRTISTVFTHDHFGPSTIQQHGFYSALLVEPRGSTWKKPDGTPLEDSNGQAVGTQAIIETPKHRKVAPHLIGSRREFAMAVADFALLYDKNDKPVAAPERPEAISVDHHDPYLFNYKHEPFPLRMGQNDGSGKWQQRSGDRGDMAYVFDSITHRANTGSDLGTVDLRRNHVAGDPSTEIFEAYSGDPVQIRLIQGAQEVQHVFTIAGRSWRRQPAAPDSAIVSSQEIGISEHFEMDFSLPFNARFGERSSFDYLYTAGTVDALWNGAWGLIRSYPNPSTVDASRTSMKMRCRLAVLGAPGSAANNAPDAAECGGRRPATTAAEAETYAAIPANLGPNAIKGVEPGASTVRPDRVVTARLFCITAAAGPITYNARDGITDPAAARFRLTHQYAVTLAPDSWFQPKCAEAAADAAGARYTALPVPADTTKPMVLRMRSGEFGFAELVNNIGTPTMTSGNAVLPPIVSSSSNSPYSDGTANDRITPSATVGITPQLVSMDIKQNAGLRVGLNVSPLNPTDAAPQMSSQTKGAGFATMSWYAGRTVFRNKNGKRSIKFKPFDVATGLVSPLSSWADPIRHPTMGLVGALVIEPANAEIREELDGGTMATICTGKGSKRKCFKEAVLVYQDGLNLKKAGVSIPDCHVCDDTYDSGDIAFNYRTEPLWSRLGLPTTDGSPNDTSGRPQLVDLSNYALPANLLLPEFKPLETPTFKVCTGERLVVRAVHPGGRARQRAFVTYGHRYDDQEMAGFGSPQSALLAPHRALTANLGSIREGRWLYRDGAGQFFGGGAWGYIEGSTCPAP